MSQGARSLPQKTSPLGLFASHTRWSRWGFFNDQYNSIRGGVNFVLCACVKSREGARRGDRCDGGKGRR